MMPLWTTAILMSSRTEKCGCAFITLGMPVVLHLEWAMTMLEEEPMDWRRRSSIPLMLLILFSPSASGNAIPQES
ncbi:hypothetical protein MT325_m038L [Paramecium bursaria chlorella virus MT325]|uniref:Uncharacterized protein m038L n=1 Tax=Paramecium bursaria Chlorella virus MT325 TaxID=346932 RepID=A7ITB8_PBCVM|nr:hypothetical protein MT325_m038L [Paramecium bursaria chlorella virus MT325]